MLTKSESPTDVERWFRAQVAGLWPAALGSLSFRRSPCVRDHCDACARGDQHPSYVLYCRIKGRRVGIYVPDELVPAIRRSLDNGRALQDLLGGQALASRRGLLEAPLQVAPHVFDDRRVRVDEIGDGLQRGLELNVLVNELKIGEADLTVGGSTHFLACGG